MIVNDETIPEYLRAELESETASLKSTKFSLPEISNRDRALFLIGEPDLEAQLIAIKGMLRRHAETEQLVSKKIKELDARTRAYAGASDEYQQHLEDQWVDAIHWSVFQDAAHSMSAVGMLAPFVESLFVSVFRGLRRQLHEDTANDPRTAATQDQYWNPQIVYRKDGQKDDVVAGINQLAISTGLHNYLPGEYQKTLSALFGYRNNMFHNGFEWPPETRQRFAQRIASGEWPRSWFSQATRNDEPWIFYMSDESIAHCLKMIDQVLDGVGEYITQPKGDLT
ncbi:conserved hypothetical protein [Roseibium sp. TrichSKD4]|uniref:hypothetical protein n=1 Tax=Roseibium sp. TrichSKD4 TaxID=744980 RepID=UPI0001E56BF0|nr:hypothetical protein [Roseibium sp. TrichSKD4]EFO30176.1 conserved hypothetical protein [Roseibium sp. TrichSKD4]